MLSYSAVRCHKSKISCCIMERLAPVRFGNYLTLLLQIVIENISACKIAENLGKCNDM